MSLPQTMKAIVTVGQGGYDTLQYRDVSVPQPQAGEVLLRVLAAGMNNTEINTRLGWYSSDVSGSTDSTATNASDKEHDDGGGRSDGQHGQRRSPRHLAVGAAALLLAGCLWSLYFMGVADDLHTATHALERHLSEVSQIVFFLIGAMTLVEVIDSHGSFRLVTDQIRTRSKLRIMWLLAVMAFFMSALLDNLTTTIVMVSLLRRILPNRENRMLLGSMVVVAANAESYDWDVIFARHAERGPANERRAAQGRRRAARGGVGILSLDARRGTPGRRADSGVAPNSRVEALDPRSTLVTPSCDSVNQLLSPAASSRDWESSVAHHRESESSMQTRQTRCLRPNT